MFRAPHRLIALIMLLFAALGAVPARANHIRASLVVESPVAPGGTATLAVLMEPEAGWHGYWTNPGDAGLALTLAWALPAGAEAGTPQFPVPQTLLVSGLMNHVYEKTYAVLVPLTVPASAVPGSALAVSAKAEWLACTEEICVPERTTLDASLRVAGPGVPATTDPRFTAWRAALPAPLDRPAAFAMTRPALRLAVPFPAGAKIGRPHLFLASEGLVDYAAPQRFARAGDMLIVEIPRAKLPPAVAPSRIDALLALDDGSGGGLTVTAAPGPVPNGGTPLAMDEPKGGTNGFLLALLGALAGGLILNVMPCVFPILSLKALALARAGDEHAARSEGLAYTAGVVLACVLLGAAMLALRAAGEEVGWAFQLQQPGIVLALLVLAAAITANFAGLYELPGLSLESGPGGAAGVRGAFATGLLAAFVATPCTGPFMAAAVGAALVLPKALALAVFAALGLGLALPFLLLGFVPALRRLLPKPGRWMETFRRAMALPMALTTLALCWLVWRSGGALFLAAGVVLSLVALLALGGYGRTQRRGRSGRGWLALMLPIALGGAAATSFAVPPPPGAAVAGARRFSEGELAAARASGKPVFLYFTADWCLSCKVNERVAIESGAATAAFRKAGVQVLVGDWTRRDPAITGFLTTQGAAGVPLYLWYAPGKATPQQLPQVLTPDLLAGLATGR